MQVVFQSTNSTPCSSAEQFTIDSELFDNGKCDADSCVVEWRLDFNFKCSSGGSWNVDLLTCIKRDDKKDSPQADSGLETI